MNPEAVVHSPSLPVPEIGLGLGDLEARLAEDVWESIERGIVSDAALEDAGDPEAVFRAVVRRSVRAIAREGRASLLRHFLTAGPFCDSGEIPRERASEFQSDGDVEATIRFIHASVISRFQGALAELLAIGPVCEIAERACSARGTRLFAGDTVRALTARGRRLAKGADFHLIEERGAGEASRLILRGVAEVKSYAVPGKKLGAQLDRHLLRARRGLEVLGCDLPAERIELGEPGRPALRIVVEPSNWKLPRDFKIERGQDGSRIVEKQFDVPMTGPAIEKSKGRDWRVVLRWSREALAAQAYEITFRYLSEVGRTLYATKRPAGWENLSPEEAGENAVKMMPYYAILRATTPGASSRAVALYNTYGFGYALGANFVDSKGRREMLWVDDLREIAERGYAWREARVLEAKDGGAPQIIPGRRCRIR